MTADVLVIGAGPAGLAAVTELAHLGLTSLLVEQRDQPGGAIYRRHAGDGRHVLLLPEHHRRRRDALMQGFAQAQSRITSLFSSVFLGVDRDGRFLLDNRALGRVQSVRPKAVILAVGTVEQVHPREGWELPGVVTVGGMQVQFKETGQTPVGPILLAGSGSLLLGLAAQLAAAGNAPIAVLERAQPLASVWWQSRAVFNALRSWPHVQEAALYARELWRARVPYLTGWQVRSLQALHDGLQPNTTGLPAPVVQLDSCIVHAGDCREVLGASAAVDDGRRAAQQVARHLGQRCDSLALDRTLASARRTQSALAQLFQAAPTPPTANTVVCRCEGVRRSDFDRLQVAGSAHELRLIGRFGMGACQDRFCAHCLSALAHERGIDFDPSELGGDVPRWPLRPVSLSALAAYEESDIEAVS